jgi:voltage-gated potassium channel
MLLKYSKLKLLIQLERVVHVLIFLNLGAYSLETVKELSDYFTYFDIFEAFSLFVFAAEYAVRVTLSILQKKPYEYIFSAMGIIDFVSIFPIFIPYVSKLDLRWVKMLRLFQVFRIFKLYRYYEHLRTIVDVFRSKKEDLIATFFSIVLVLVFCSCVTYFFEKDVQPLAFNNLFSALYWGVTTLTTIAYGDIYPVTAGGKAMAAILAFLGIGLVALPAGILSAGFIEVNEKKRERLRKKQA